MVNQKLSELQAHVDNMRLRCDEAEAQLSVAHAASKPLLERASSLRREQAEVKSMVSVINAFLDKFTLTDQETDALISRDIPIGPKFFAAMDRTERVRDECTVLMAGEDGPTQVG